MAATVTLSTTTLVAPVAPDSTSIVVASTTGISEGLGLFADAELMSVVSIGLPTRGGTAVNVLRGRGGSTSQNHSSGATVYIGRSDQFYSQDPVGAPGAVVLVSPWINVTNGRVWLPQGDELPLSGGPQGQTNTSRWWQQVVTTYGQGDLGIRTATQSPTTSN